MSKLQNLPEKWYFNLTAIFFQVKWDSMGCFHSIMCRMHHSATKFFVRAILSPGYLVVVFSWGFSNWISDFVGTHLLYDVLPGLWSIGERKLWTANVRIIPKFIALMAWILCSCSHVWQKGNANLFWIFGLIYHFKFLFVSSMAFYAEFGCAVLIKYFKLLSKVGWWPLWVVWYFEA